MTSTTTVAGSGDAVVAAAEEAVQALVASVSRGPGTRSRDEWLALVGTCQTLSNSLAAAQDAALVQVARREQVWADDGTLGEQAHAPGRVALDAADLAAPVLGCSHAQAERRVLAAVRLAAGAEPTEVDDRGPVHATGLDGLHTAMADGRLDAYRAGVVAFELDAAPAGVAGAVVAALEPHLATADAAALRRRTRRILARVSPDLLRQRAVRARAATGLRRWASEPGVDTWMGTFPSEQSAAAWAAVDRLAHDYVRGGRCTTIEQARGQALTDLVCSNATVDVRVVLAVPAGAPVVGEAAAPAAATPPVAGCTAGARPPERAAAPADGTADDLVLVQGARPSEPMLVARGWLAAHLDPAAAPVACHPTTGARLDATGDLTGGAYRPGRELAALVRARDGRCRFPGCAVAARFCDLDHVRPWPSGPTAARNLLTLCRRHHRIKQSPGWSVRLAPDGTAQWTDPIGRTRTTEPLDALETLVLSADRPAPAPRPAPVSLPEWSCLETALEHRLEQHQLARAAARRCVVTPELERRMAAHRRRSCAAADDPPPF
ncbi:HNH endonuclease signature motif containing protein [Nostocoides sp. Soil756]|jgi:hypothetical protein|uniref:HNH endonuclease signature motif containing protein n=1 Tax=Nostocoides sp. Soil756 TaxID=1736399 RepID=UPI0007022C82|nr:HNH endonuclease signature motif containing protein [Tetrasphaera sp. Soil756]KRE62272.1 hypothetical protein ASG78_04280 [Tetrasphaera sp. Soil756]